jgi:hypothetical protein
LFLETKDYVTFSKDGIHVAGLGPTYRRAIKDNEGTDKILHSLDSMSCLKIDDDNHIKYGCQKHDKREIWIEQEYYSGDVGKMGDNTKFMSLYKIKIW